MKEIVKDFYEKKLSKILYKDAIDMMKELKNVKIVRMQQETLLPEILVNYQRSN